MKICKGIIRNIRIQKHSVFVNSIFKAYRMKSFTSTSSKQSSIVNSFTNLLPNIQFDQNQDIKEDLFQKVFLNESFLALYDNDAKRDIFENYYWMIYQYVKFQYEETNKRSTGQTAFLMGLSAPQGSGKTTLTDLLRKFFAYENLNLINLSLDDFYLRGSEQDALALNHPDNNLFKYRGNAGTHDVPLLEETLHSLKNSRNQSSKFISIKVPRYDKSLRNGLGDRAPEEDWTKITEPVDIVLLEGWMLGFQAKPLLKVEDCADAIQQFKILYPTVNEVELFRNISDVNDKLREYKTMHELIDSWIVYQISDVSIVYQWRLQAEHDLHRKFNRGLSDEQVKDFVARFMPAYYTYLPAMYAHGPERRCSSETSVDVLQVSISSNRYPIDIHVR